MNIRSKRFFLSALFGASLFWTGLAHMHGPPVSDISGAHPGLKDDALKKALRKDRTHDVLSYRQARTAVFSKIDGNGKKSVGRFTGEPISYVWQPLPHVGNIGHIWPRTRLPKEASTDLHHLFPVIPEANLARNTLKFGNVMVPAWSRGGSRTGVSKKGRVVFQVRPDFRGDVARSMFYVATMYQLNIDPLEEKALRAWHESDPVSAVEKKRNKLVRQHQKSTNPFIDNPKLVDRIVNF